MTSKLGLRIISEKTKSIHRNQHKLKSIEAVDSFSYPESVLENDSTVEKDFRCRIGVDQSTSREQKMFYVVFTELILLMGALKWSPMSGKQK